MLVLLERSCLACLALLLVSAGGAATFGVPTSPGQNTTASQPAAATRALEGGALEGSSDSVGDQPPPASDTAASASASRLPGTGAGSGPVSDATSSASRQVASAGITVEAGGGHPAAQTVPGVAHADADADAGETASAAGADDEVAAQSDGDEAAAASDGDTAPAGEQPAVYTAPDGEQIDAGRLRRFLEDRGAPLAAHAETLVDAGVDQGVDPRIVVGIAVAESAGGERLPVGTHNAWGWSGNGPYGLKAWASWPAAIDDFTARYARLYGTGPVDADVAQTYVPPNWRWWLETVTWVVDEI